MAMAIGIALIWLGAVLIYVAVHGVESGRSDFSAVWEQALRDVAGEGSGG